MAVDTTRATECFRENKETLLDTLMNGPRSAKLFKLQTGIKSHDYLHIAKTEINFDDCGCTQSDNTNHVFLDREISVGCVKVEDKVCAFDFDNMYLEAEINVIAGHETLGEAGGVLAYGFATAIANRLDTAIWQGDKASADRNLNKFDGILKIMSGETEVTKIDLSTISDSWELVMALVRALPESAYLRGATTTEGAQPVVIMPATLFRNIMFSLTDKALNACCPSIVPQKFRDFDSFVFPNTDIRFIGVPGMNGTNQIIGGSLYDLYLGADMENAEEEIDGWWSQDADAWRQRAKFKYGTQVAFPRDMFLATYTPPDVSPLNAGTTTFATPALTEEQKIDNAKAAVIASYEAKANEAMDTASGIKASNTKALNNAKAALTALGVDAEEFLAEYLNASGGSDGGDDNKL